MKLATADGIVLRNRDFKERDRLVTFITRDCGKLTGIARGVRKLTSREIAAHEPFTRCVLHYSEKPTSDLVHIRKADVLPPYLILSQDLDGYLYLTYFAELVDLVSVPRQAVPELFDLLERTLFRVAESKPASWPVFRLEFEMDWLLTIGIAPEWRRCVGCARAIYGRTAAGLRPQQEAPHGFDAAAGGIRCPSCVGLASGGHRLSFETLTQLAPWRLAHLAPRPLASAAGQSGVGEEPSLSPVPGDRALGELTACVQSHLRYHLEWQPRSLRLLPRSHLPSH